MRILILFVLAWAAVDLGAALQLFCRAFP